MKSRSMRVARNIVVSIVVLLALLVGGGFVYTYFFGPDSTQSTTATPPAPPVSPEIKPSKANPNAPVSASVTVLTSPVAPGNNASTTIKTTPGAACKIIVAYGDTASTDSGLAAKVADEFGTVSWTWTVDSTAALGTWPVKVTCAFNAKSAVVQGDLVVAK